jgi:hypothetical protein
MLKNKSYNTTLSNCDDNPDYLIEYNTDGDTEFGQASNVVFSTVVEEDTIVNHIDESDNNDDNEEITP